MHNNFLKLKGTQLFYLDIKFMKPFAVPKACTKCKTKRGISIISFRDDNYTDVTKNVQLGTYVYSNKPN